jgi:hypothetical protein
VLREVDTTRQVPGVVAMNNILYNNVTGGILFSGDPGNDAAVPFGRIVNNTLYGRGGTLSNVNVPDTGISVTQNAAPTLLNNIIANFRNGVNVDATSQALTVLGGMVFQGNNTNSNVGLGGDFPIALANTDPLFVNPSLGNFYLRARSQAIDSAVDSLLDRPAMVTMRDPLGISPSPILSPDRDAFGQLRVNDPDPATTTPDGAGLNPNKDRGAIDRVDFTGPTSFLIDPQDNDAEGLDLDPASTVVVLTGQIVDDFRIRLLDRTDPNGPPDGSDIDDFTVTSSQVSITAIGGPNPGLQIEGTHYTFNYDTTNNVIILTPTGGLWPTPATYVITIDNSTATGIADRAGNTLIANQLDGSHTYTIFLDTAQDWGDLPDSTIDPRFLFHTSSSDPTPGPSHSILQGFSLGATNGAEGDGVPSLNADSDTADDGISAITLQPNAGLLTSSITVTANFTTSAMLDGWIDLNRDGDFDDTVDGVSEHVLDAVALTTPGGPQIIPFTLGAGPRGQTYARFRMTESGIDTPDGPGGSGEVEDYVVTLTGPTFNNPLLAQDVTNDGIVSPADLLTVINFIIFLGSPTVRDYSVDPDGAGPLTNSTLFLPPTSPGYFTPAPTFDPTGGAVPGHGKYVDVAVPFGILNAADLLSVVNYMIANFNGAGGEGEAPPAAAMASTTAPAAAKAADAPATAAASLQTSAVLYASSSVVFEQKPASPDSTLAGEALLPQAAGESLDLSFVGAPVGPAWTDLADQARRKLRTGPLDDQDWDGLLGDLALDVGGLNGDGDQG